MTTSFFHPDWGALNLPQLAAMVPDEEIKIIDNWHHWFRQETVIQSLKHFKPDVLAISNSTAADTNRVLEMVEKIRTTNSDIRMIAGGQAASVRYKDFLDVGFETVVMGEGEYSFKDIIERMKKGECDFSDIPGLSFKKAGEYTITTPRPLLKTIDNLPFPAWHLMPQLRSNFFKGMHASVIESSRGCPYTCDFCAVQSFWKRSYRKKSNERIIEELKYLKTRLGCGQVYFIDDSFALNVKEYTELFEMMIRKNLTVKGFSQIRPDTVANNPEMIELAARAGFWGFLVGFDSYNEDELKMVHKSGGTDINNKASEILRKNGIGIFGVHMFGMPGIGLNGFKKTFKMGMRNSDTFRMSRFSLIPGTPLFSTMLQQNKVDEAPGRYVPYSHKIKTDKNRERKTNLLYVWYEFKSLLGLKAIAKFIKSRGISRKLQFRAYITATRYVLYLGLRKIGIEIL